MRKEQDYTTHSKTATSRPKRCKKFTSNWALRMTDIKWYSIDDLYTIEKYKIKHNRKPKTQWVRLPCVYKIKIANKIVIKFILNIIRRAQGVLEVFLLFLGFLLLLAFFRPGFWSLRSLSWTIFCSPCSSSGPLGHSFFRVFLHVKN